MPVDMLTINIRFIPAWAGNSFLVNCWIVWHTVHPRVGGEQALQKGIPNV